MVRTTVLVLATAFAVVGTAADSESTETTSEESGEQAAKTAQTATDPPDAETSDSRSERGTPPKDPPPPVSIEPPRGPDVTLIAGEERAVYEYRQNGKLRMIKVVPKRGKPYYLVPRDPTQGFGDLEQADTLVPRWVLIEF